MQSLKSRIAVGYKQAHTTDARVCDTVNKISDLRTIVNGLNRTVRGDRAHVAEIGILQSIGVQLVITTALVDSGSAVSDVICEECNEFNIESYSEPFGPYVEGSSNQGQFLFFLWPLFYLSSTKSCWFTPSIFSCCLLDNLLVLSYYCSLIGVVDWWLSDESRGFFPFGIHHFQSVLRATGVDQPCCSFVQGVLVSFAVFVASDCSVNSSIWWWNVAVCFL